MKKFHQLYHSIYFWYETLVHSQSVRNARVTNLSFVYCLNIIFRDRVCSGAHCFRSANYAASHFDERRSVARPRRRPAHAGRSKTRRDSPTLVSLTFSM